MIDSLFWAQPSLSSDNTEVSVCCALCLPVTNIYHPGFCVNKPAGKSHSATSGCIIYFSGHLWAPELVCGCTSIICNHFKCAYGLSPACWLFDDFSNTSEINNLKKKTTPIKVIFSNNCATFITMSSIIQSQQKLWQFGMLDVTHTRCE